ncbi:Arc family DNA-binding protein [Pseudomonas denitrificans (nom. rej.)]|nr:Arc family DNA-binding protein [Pseudomonas denitrificans (nom. rej.)]
MAVKKITTVTRLPVQMREGLEERAADNGRSLSGEIVYRLRKSLEQEEQRDAQNKQA